MRRICSRRAFQRSCGRRAARVPSIGARPYGDGRPIAVAGTASAKPAVRQSTCMNLSVFLARSAGHLRTSSVAHIEAVALLVDNRLVRADGQRGDPFGGSFAERDKCEESPTSWERFSHA